MHSERRDLRLQSLTDFLSIATRLHLSFVSLRSIDLVSSMVPSSSQLDPAGSVGQSFIPVSAFVWVNAIHIRYGLIL